MTEANLAIGLVISPAAGLMPVRGRITRLSARRAVSLSSLGHVSPLDPLREENAEHETLQEIILSAPAPGWFASLDPVAQYQFCASLLNTAWRPTVSIYA